MAVFVDPMVSWGWMLRGKKRRSCHMFTDEKELDSLHEMARRIGMKREWFQDHALAPHYDLTDSRRALAVRLGAVEVDRKQAVAIWRARRKTKAVDATTERPAREES